jgi:hypothetical protein
MLARERDRNGRELPQVELLAPARDDAAGQLLGDDHVGIERQVRPVLLDCAERQAEDRRLLQTPGDLGKGEASDRSREGRARHDPPRRNQPLIMRMRTRSLRRK